MASNNAGAVSTYLRSQAFSGSPAVAASTERPITFPRGAPVRSAGPDLSQVFTTRMLNSIADLDHDVAVALFGDAMEGASYLRACENSEANPQATCMIAVSRGDVVVAAAPVLRFDHRLDMALGDRCRGLRDIVHRHAPRLVTLPVMCLGTRTSEECPIGFSPKLSASEREQVLGILLDGLAHHASKARVKILAIKDFADRDTLWASSALNAGGFAQMPSPPIATLHLPFADEAGYFASLSANMRKNWKRKLKGFGKVDVEIRHSIDGIEDEIVELFEQTKARRKTDYGEFSDVPPGYFREVIEALGERAIIVLTRVDGVLASFSLSILDGDRLVGKYVGMRYPLAVEHDIYFLNWLTLVRYCLKHRISWMQVGQTCYQQKVRLGCQLMRSWVYFKHTGAILGPVLRFLGPRLASFDAIDPDLAALGADVPYLPADAETGAGRR